MQYCNNVNNVCPHLKQHETHSICERHKLFLENDSVGVLSLHNCKKLHNLLSKFVKEITRIQINSDEYKKIKKRGLSVACISWKDNSYWSGICSEDAYQKLELSAYEVFNKYGDLVETIYE